MTEKPSTASFRDWLAPVCCGTGRQSRTASTDPFRFLPGGRTSRPETGDLEHTHTHTHMHTHILTHTIPLIGY